MSAAFIAKICCAFPGMEGWRHLVKPDGAHVWWSKTKRFGLAIFIYPDVGGTPLYLWKVKRLADGLEVEGMVRDLVGGTQAAVIAYERWRDRDDKFSKPQPERRWLPAVDEPLPF